jgi:tRNA modification GTPase
MRRLPGETIAAISTALGPGAIAVVRLSGDDAIEIGDRVFRGGRSLSSCPSHTAHIGRIIDGRGGTVDEVLATIMRSPNTYTTEHMIEFGCHGGPLPAREVLSACLAAGARQAGPGEFTQRAFMNGRIDLVQAEAIADVISSRTRKGLDLALGQLEGALSEKLALLKEALLEMRAQVEAAIDFSDDVDVSQARADVSKAAGRAGAIVRELLSSCDLGVAMRDGVTVAIVGKPNVGKSSLMNALIARDRSIVTDVPGTTRDVVEACVNMEGVPFTLVDTAGWRSSLDVAEQAGVMRARAAAEAADLCLLVVDASQRCDDDDRSVAAALAPGRTIIVGNKRDLGGALGADELGGLLRSGHRRTALVSATRGDGLAELRAAIVEAGLGSAEGGQADVSNVRHIDALRRVQSSLDEVADIAGAAHFEIMGAELAEATDALGTISGETTPEDVIERIFERFCIGK